jgi:hypothetical protein
LFGNICTDPVKFLKLKAPVLLWVWALASCKIPIIDDAVSTNTVIINVLLFLVIISFFTS